MEQTDIQRHGSEKAYQIKEPAFGKAQGGLPSWFARVPTKAIHDKRLKTTDLKCLMIICSYANNQGFAWPNQSTLCEVYGIKHDRSIKNYIRNLKKYGYLEVVSRYRSHPKWRRVMGNVYRIIYDDRMTTEELIHDMDREDVSSRREAPPVDEATLPTQTEPTGNQGASEGNIELVDVEGVTRWFARVVKELDGIVIDAADPRTANEVRRLIDDGWTRDEIEIAASKVQIDRRQRGQATHRSLDLCQLHRSMVDSVNLPDGGIVD